MGIEHQPKNSDNQSPAQENPPKKDSPSNKVTNRLLSAIAAALIGGSVGITGGALYMKYFSPEPASTKLELNDNFFPTIKETGELVFPKSKESAQVKDDLRVLVDEGLVEMNIEVDEKGGIIPQSIYQKGENVKGESTVFVFNDKGEIVDEEGRFKASQNFARFLVEQQKNGSLTIKAGEKNVIVNINYNSSK